MPASVDPVSGAGEPSLVTVHERRRDRSVCVAGLVAVFDATFGEAFSKARVPRLARSSASSCAGVVPDRRSVAFGRLCDRYLGRA